MQYDFLMARRKEKPKGEGEENTRGTWRSKKTKLLKKDASRRADWRLCETAQ